MSLKTQAKSLLQRGLGFHNYLVAHSMFVALSMRFRRSEGDVVAFIARLQPDSIVLDIGANVGAMTLLFARACPQGKVFAFEPIPESHRAAAAIIRLFRIRNAQLFQFGLGERDESVQMIMPQSDAGIRMEGLSHVVGAPGDARPADSGALYNVRLLTIDGLPELEHVRVSAIKIDVEDHERFVLRGGRNVIQRDHPLIYCELWGTENKAECFATLADLGYDSFVVSRHGLQPYDAARHRHANFLFVPREQLAEYAVNAPR